MVVKYLKDITLFLLLFVSFNDTLSIDLTGDETIIKMTLGLFVIVHFYDYIEFLFSQKSLPIKAFYLFFITVLSVTLISNIFYFDNTLMVGITRLTAVFALFVYFSYTKELEKALYMFWIVMVISSILAYFSAPVEAYTFRKTGGTSDPNEFAAQILTVIFVTMYLFQKNKNFVFLFASLGLFFYTLLYAGSKSSFIFLAVMLFITVIVKFSTIIRYIASGKGLVASIVLLGVLTAGIVMSNKAVTGLQARAQKTGTLQQRLIVWRAGGEMIRDHFFMGVGFGEFPNVSGKYLKDYLAEEAKPSHNDFIKVFAESGVFAFLAFLFFIMTLFGTKFSQIVASDYFWLYLASLSAILMGLTIPSLHHKDFWISLALISNVILILTKQEEELQYVQDG